MELIISGFTVLLDDDDIEKVSRYSWSFNQKGYFFAHHSMVNGKQKHIKLHRLIMEVMDPTVFIDHINMDTTDNRKCNLRICTKSQNGMNRPKQGNNTSGRKGVHWAGNVKKWRARICVNRKHISLGVYDDKEDAAEAYKKATLEYHGHFARVE